MKKAIIALLAVVALVGTSCSDITEVYDPIGFWSALYFPGGFSGWFVDDGNNTEAEQAATGGTQIATTPGYASTWTFTTVDLDGTNRAFKIVPNEAKWSGDIGWGGINQGASTGVQDSGGNIAITAAAIADGNPALITVDQGLWDAENLVLNPPVITISAPTP